MKKQDSLQLLNTIWAEHPIRNPSKREALPDITSELINLFTSGHSYFFTIDFTIPEIDFVSENSQDFTGIEKDNFNLENWLKLWHKEDYDMLAVMEQCKGKFLFEFIPREEIIHYKICQSYRLRQSDGTYRHFLNQMSPLVLTEDYQVQKTLLVQSDISHLRVPTDRGLSFVHMHGGKSYYSEDLENFIECKQLKNSFSKREKDILRLISEGKSSQQISDQLFISKNTVDTHRRNILKKTSSSNMIEVVSDAIRNGWI